LAIQRDRWVSRFGPKLGGEKKKTAKKEERGHRQPRKARKRIQEVEKRGMEWVRAKGGEEENEGDTSKEKLERGRQAA